MPAAMVATGPMPTAGAPDLRLPHEHDQSGVDATTDVPDPMMVQAAKDLQAGQVDTDLHNTAGLDAVRRETLLKPPQR